ncbi:hypothetical protein EVB41_003 [Rhizobium phage RHph_TM3_14A]|nr:hypothetical protein EVB29_003 [Rhizobium phage RHph_TM27A]QIG66923.1 hypothetical protein EVB30_003 [Rhizobium phage RHph_TM27B]QIG67013.1 hypothetical protein EVB31_003 [Rhizobium phage RHph_TM29]QIG67468.1 hypothetical protein EVB41_003 [Rhizobium phage RHph_TM3_14A]
MLGSYSKIIGALLGNVIAILLVWLGSKGLATCVPGPTPDVDQVCTIGGFTTAQITAAVMTVFNMAFVYFFPANKPAA